MMYSSIELGMEVETHDGRTGQVVASPRNGKWLVQLDNGREHRYREEELNELDRDAVYSEEYR